MNTKQKLKEFIDKSSLEPVSVYLWEIFLEKISDADTVVYERYLTQYPNDLKLVTEIVEKKLWAFFTGNKRYMESVIAFEVETLRNGID